MNSTDERTRRSQRWGCDGLPLAPPGRPQTRASALAFALLVGLPACGEWDDGRPEGDTDAGTTDGGAGVSVGVNGIVGETDPSGGETSGDDSGGELDPGGTWPDGPVLYPAARAHSPITPYVADNLRSIATVRPQSEGVFAKVGASSSVSSHYMRCFDGDDIDFAELPDQAELWDTVDFFGAQTLEGGESSFGRETLAAEVGWPAFKVLDGDPSRLQQEVDAIAPRYAVVHYGTNDIGWGDLHGFGDDMLTIVDTLTDQGVIPLLSTILRRGDSAAADARVPRYNAVIRAVAQARQVPLLDLFLETSPLPDHGLAGDGVHPSVYAPDGVARSCVFTPAGLAAGHPIRNLLTLQGLDRARRVVAEHAPSLDDVAPQLTGEGSRDDPFLIDPALLPFSDLRDTASEGFSELDHYSGCGADQDESGREFLYRVELAAPATLWAAVFDRGAVDIDVQLLDETASEAGCIARHDQELEVALPAGVYYLALDTYVGGSGAKAGEYFVVVDILE
ncbi:MAG: SGNH/GDSL hydrolase family protein [Myxococcales bacterium]|nr:SGNH/GDSL hydrolase family protein [Myxococcales bacterium]